MLTGRAQACYEMGMDASAGTYEGKGKHPVGRTNVTKTEDVTVEKQERRSVGKGGTKEAEDRLQGSFISS